MTTLPPIPAPLWDNIPAALRDAGPYWVCYRAPVKRKSDGSLKRDKCPVNPRTGANASSNKPDTWGTFDEARAWYEAHNELEGKGTIAGVGIQIRPAAGIVGVDFDHVINPETGECQDDAWRALETLNTYTELSPSGDGLHAFALGKLQITSEKYPTGMPYSIEFFADRFFLTVTGQRAPEFSAAVEPRQKELADLFVQCEATRTQAAKANDESPPELADLAAFESGVLPLLAALDPQTRRAHTGEAGHPGFLWSVLCPWRDEHTGGTDRAAVFFFPGGHLPGFSCFHAHCRERGWAQLAEKLSLPLPSWLDQFNAEYAVANLSGKTVILHETEEPVMGRPIVEYQQIGDFHNFFANKTRTIRSGGRNVEVHLSKDWFRHPARRQYDGVVYDPTGRQHPGRFNLWRGFSVTPAAGDWSLLRTHIRDIICAGDEAHYEYLLDWLADIVQDPGERPGVCVAMRGPQGAGKGVFAREVGSLFRSHFIHLTTAKQLTGNFNSHLAAGLLIFADEAIFAADRSQEGHLKALITEDLQLIEPKNVNAFFVRNFARILMATNSRWAIPAGLDDRRYFVLDVAGDVARDVAYFGALLDQQRNGGREAMLYDLLARQYNKNALRIAPQTEALAEQKEHSLNSIEQYLADCLELGALLQADEEHEWTNRTEWPESATKDSIYLGYKRHAKEAMERHPKARNVFFREFLRLLPGQVWHSRDRLDLPPLAKVRDLWHTKLTGHPEGTPF